PLGPRRLRRDDKWLVAAGGEEFRYPHHAVRDAVDVGRERFGNDRDPHAQKGRYERIEAPQPPGLSGEESVTSWLRSVSPGGTAPGIPPILGEIFPPKPPRLPNPSAPDPLPGPQ